VLFYLYIGVHSNFMQFHYCLIVHQRPPNFHVIYNGFNLTVFDGLSNDNEIIRNLIDHQSKDIKKNHFKIFLYLFRSPLSRLSK
jgi:hypothetical protein